MNRELLLKELQFKAVRSSGAGGQHVNKVSSKVILSFDLFASEALLDEEKQCLQERLKTQLSNEGILSLQCSESRSQHKNKALVIERFFELLTHKLKPKKARKKTKPTKSAIEKRLDNKKKQALKKVHRKPPEL